MTTTATVTIKLETQLTVTGVKHTNVQHNQPVVGQIDFTLSFPGTPDETVSILSEVLSSRLDDLIRQARVRQSDVIVAEQALIDRAEDQKTQKLIEAAHSPVPTATAEAKAN